jgi:hypothetical protein
MVEAASMADFLVWENPVNEERAAIPQKRCLSFIFLIFEK